MRPATPTALPYRAALAVLLVVVGIVPLPSGAAASPGTASNQQGTCDRLIEPSGVTNAGPNATVPVVFVHGLASDAGRWNKPARDGGQNLAQSLADLLETSVWAFDYGDAGLEWVDDPRIGPALAQTIRCLHDVSGTEVVLITHSNGGNAVQHALGESDIAEMVAHVTAIASPFEGSELIGGLSVLSALRNRPAAGIRSLAWRTASQVFLSYCAQLARDALEAGSGHPCAYISLLETPVGQGVIPGSDELAALPPWPASVPVFKVAANIEFFPFHLPPVQRGTGLSVGDLTISTSSALADHIPEASEPLVLECPGPGELIWALRSRCFHTNITEDREVIDTVRGQVETEVDRLAADLDADETGRDAPDDETDGALADRTYSVDCPGGPGDYEMTDGRYEDDNVLIGLVDENLIDLNGNGEDDAVVLLSCAFGAGSRRDFLYVFEGLGDGEWEQRDTAQAPYIIRTGEDTYESYDPLPAPDDPNCCPSEYSQMLWRAELDGDYGLIVQDVPLTIPADELPDDPHEPRF